MVNLTDLKDRIEQEFLNLTFDVSEWEEVLESTSYVPIYYQKSLIDYYTAYYEGSNLSFILRENNIPLAIFPFFVYQNEGQWVLSVNGESLVPPLYAPKITKKLRKRLEKDIIKIIYQLAQELGVKKIDFIESTSKISSWYLFWLEQASQDYLTYHLGIDLEPSVEEIRLNFRKSYKPLVNKALKEWDVEVCDQIESSSFDEFKSLHLEVAGRKTRNDESWDVQKQQIINKEAFLITVRDKKALIGAGLFNYSRDVGMYSVGAYKRELFDKPIGHAVQMKAVEKLKNLGCSKYYLGKRASSLYIQPSSEKEFSISHFKEGFANYIYPQAHIEVLP